MPITVLLSFLSVARAQDSDGDSLTDVQEDLNGNGNPSDDDSDGDGLPNYLDPDDDDDSVPTRTEVTPRVRDTDGDMLPDYLDWDDDNDQLRTITELGVTGTDPLQWNTDFSLYARSDGQEILDGTDPFDGSDDARPSHPMSALNPGRAGRVNTVTVQGGTPGAAILLFGSDHQPAPFVPTAVPPCPGLFTALASPQLVGVALADNTGVATFNVSVPAALAGRWIQLQAIEPSVCELSTTTTDQL